MANNRLRIIGGQWRGRKLPFSDADGLRPTPDRVRETLFNWLAAYTTGARCLDMFAGTGALGIEAASRGAESVVLFDSNRQSVAQIRENIKLLQAGNIMVENRDALQGETAPSQAPFDIVFLDPPYHRDLLASAVSFLCDTGYLADDAWVYMECARDESIPPLPGNWHPHRSGRAGQVAYSLFHVTV